MSVIETLTGDLHTECRDRLGIMRSIAEKYAAQLAHLRMIAGCDDHDELVEWMTRRRADDVEIGDLCTRLEAAGRASKPWYVADPQTLARMQLPALAVILDLQGYAWQQHTDMDEGHIWQPSGSAQWWTTRDPATYGPRFPVTILHNPKKEKK